MTRQPGFRIMVWKLQPKHYGYRIWISKGPHGGGPVEGILEKVEKHEPKFSYRRAWVILTIDGKQHGYMYWKFVRLQKPTGDN